MQSNELNKNICINNSNQSITIISIEGNIGSGKSTVINSLKQYYSTERIYFLQEPVNEWTQIQDQNGKNIIEKFYENQEKYSFSFQMMAYISRLSLIKNAIKYCENNNIKLIVCERSLQTDKNVFCKMLYDSNKIEEINYQIYSKWFDEFIYDIPKIYFLYIKTEPVIAFERVVKRLRKGENISLTYIESCHMYHNYWLIDDNVKNTVIIDGNGDHNKTFNQSKNIIDSFLN